MVLDLAKKTLFMGILNITPDSFSDGGKYFDMENALNHTKKMIKNGVDIIDVGGESTRAGAKPVSEEEELKRIIPVIKEISSLITRHSLLISVDTYKSNVAKIALEAGADMINNVSGLTMDENMVNVAREAGCPIVIMHNKGIPATKPGTRVKGNSIVEEVYNWLKKQTDYAIKNGVKKENIIIDPGLGFGKTPEEDMFLIEHLYEFKSLEFPILTGSSNKSFIRKLFPNDDFKIKNNEIVQLAIRNGANIIRMHL
jgi:dihydropteroate synthase